MQSTSLTPFAVATRVGFIGLGVMGHGMARCLLRHGYALTVTTRKPEVSSQFEALGVEVVRDAAAVGARCQLVFLCLSDADAVEEVLFGPQGLAGRLERDACIVDTSTISADQARGFSSRLQALGCHYLDAPISGGQAGAEQGILSCMVGGSAQVLEVCRGPISAFARNIFHAGPSGAGQAVKACNQVAIAAALMGISEALVLARTQGVNPHLMREILLAGSAKSTALERHTLRAIDGSFTPGFRTSLMRKDLNLALATGHAQNASMPGTELVASMLDAMCEQGRAEWDWCALTLHLQNLAGLSTPQQMEPLPSAAQS
jgi:2-hydroxy-3-oxopropionate reductase